MRRMASSSGMQVSVTRFRPLLAQGQLFVIGQIAVVGDAAVMIVGDEIKNIFFQIRARGADGVNFILPDHLGQGQSQFRCAHRAGHGQQHFSALLQVAAIGFGGIDEDGGVEVPDSGA